MMFAAVWSVGGFLVQSVVVGYLAVIKTGGSLVDLVVWRRDWSRSRYGRMITQTERGRIPGLTFGKESNIRGLGEGNRGMLSK